MPLTSWADLAMAGLSHREAKVALRERLSIKAGELPAALDELGRDGTLAGVVAVSTCNRLDLYASARDGEAAVRSLSAFFARRCPGVEKVLAARRGADALRHLFRVAAGLDSIVVGEHQVLGQVKAAYQQSVETGHADKLLNKVFQAAFAAGKQVRACTGISQGISSCGGAAVAMAEKILSCGEGPRRVLLVGAGKMAETAAQHMLDRPRASLTIANRDVERARELAGRFAARAVSLEEGMAAIGDMDVIIASTACPHYVVTKDRLAELALRRGGRPLVVIDLGVPRNVDPASAGLPGVHLYDVDDLEAVIAGSLARRRGEIEAAEAILSVLSGELCASLSCEPAPAGLELL
ncbi:MAG: glutamyl-tRNA reductase [Elusimicrobia bacterium]|nr:glutamyl-tRNA reductase [Elusimicrobiota bacterium]